MDYISLTEAAFWPPAIEVKTLNYPLVKEEGNPDRLKLTIIGVLRRFFALL